MLKAVDSTTTPSADALTKAGIQAVYRYIALGTAGKHLTKAELTKLNDAGIAVGFVAESSTTQMTRGRAGGIADGRAVVSALKGLGVRTDVGVFYANDEGVTPGALNDYLDGVASVVGAAAVGGYGDDDFIKACVAHWKKTHPSVHFGQWQTLAWSGSHLDAGVDVYQGGDYAWSGSYADYHVTIGGVGFDKDTAFSTWGLIGGDMATSTTREDLAGLLGFGNDVNRMLAAVQGADGLVQRANGEKAEPADADVARIFDFSRDVLEKSATGSGPVPKGTTFSVDMNGVAVTLEVV